MAAVGVGGEDVVRGIDRPHVAARAIGRRWARVTTQMGRGVDQLSPIGREEGARRTAAARRHQSRLAASVRSEEHTSELQSLAYLVCRLLLEKKKKKIKTSSSVTISTPAYRQHHTY